MNLKKFLKLTKWKMILFLILIALYTVFWLLPGLYFYSILSELKEKTEEIGGTAASSLFFNIPSTLQITINSIIHVVVLYLVSCLIVWIYSKVKK